MMDAVPTADVVVTNPTHYAVALRYDSAAPAPNVVAKGTDHVALPRSARRQRARRADRARPAARPRAARAASRSASMIPEELFQAVAQLLAFVYRVARRATPPEPPHELVLKRAGKHADLHGRRRRRAGRGDDDHAAARVPARPRDHAEHLGGADDRGGHAVRAARAGLLLVPEPPAAHDALPPGDQRLRHAPDPAARRRGPRGRRRSATSSSAATWSSAS